jgi:hypothetical protein
MIAFSGQRNGVHKVFYVDDIEDSNMRPVDVEINGRYIRVTETTPNIIVAEGYITTEEPDSVWPVSLLLMLGLDLSQFSVEEKNVDVATEGQNEWVRVR